MDNPAIPNGEQPTPPRTSHKETWRDVRKKRWWKPDRVLSIMVVGGISILLGGFAVYLSVRTEHHTLPRIEQYIKTEVRGALTTRSVGVFPGNMRAIRNLLEGLQSNRQADTIHIVCDMVAYGVFSNPKEYDDYRSDLVRIASDKLDVVMLQPFDSAQRRHQLDDQFDKYKEHPDFLLNSPEYDRFLSYWTGKECFGKACSSERDTSLEQFKQRIMELNKSDLEVLKKSNVLIDEEPLRSNIFMWRINHEDAVFSLYNNAIEYSPNEVSIGTRDGELIGQLLKQLPRFDFHKPTGRDPAGQVHYGAGPGTVRRR